MANVRPSPQPGWGLPLGTAVGATAGLIIGTLLGQMALWLVMGAAAGLVLGTTLTTAGAVPADRRRRVLATAIAIVLAGLVAAILILR